ncbi:MAG: NAD(P)-binding protein [Bacillota bacterium]
MAAVTKEMPPVWTTGWTDVLNTGTWRSATPLHQERPSPCRVACPAGGNIPVWLQQVREGRHHLAWLTLVAENPFPAVTGRVCRHPCEDSCNRGEYDGAVAINALEQYIGDLALEEGWPLPEPAARRDIKVAVIGGGPAGLSCAYQLRLRGYGVTVFEAQPEPGGVMRYGIPGYRLPKEIVDREIQRLLATDIEVRTGAAVRGEDLAALERDFAALCLATGAPRAKTLPQFGGLDGRVLNGLEFLLNVNRNNIPPLGRQVAVIGGGSVAMDVARTARRLGRQVKVLALEDRSSLPAQPREVQEALEEGVVIRDGVMVREAAADGDGINLACARVVLDPAAPPGALRPIVLPGTDFQIPADTVILAVGQDPDLGGFPDSLGVQNQVLEVDAGQATGRAGVFACGDVAASRRYMAEAIGSGKRAALGIEAFLEGRRADGGAGMSAPDSVSFKEINTFYFPIVPRTERKTAAPDLRLQDFREVRLALPGEEARIQVERCFSCGHCLKCDNCYYFCPDLAVIKDPSPENGYHVQDQYCKGCGLCVEECPRGAILLKEVKR